jgi:hypothetical protein
VFILYRGEEKLVATGYADASFKTNKDDYKSQLDYVVTLNGGVVSWKSSKQETDAILHWTPSTPRLLKPRRKGFK